MFQATAPIHAMKPIRIVAALTIITTALLGTTLQSQTQPPDYKNSRLPIEQRVADLLKQMTLEEKVAQLVCLWAQKPQAGPQTDFSTDRGDFSPEKARAVMKNGIGQISRQRPINNRLFIGDFRRQRDHITDMNTHCRGLALI